MGCQLLTRHTRASLIGPSAPFSAVLSGSLKVDARLAEEVAGAARIFLSANGGDGSTAASHID